MSTVTPAVEQETTENRVRRRCIFYTFQLLLSNLLLTLQFLVDLSLFQNFPPIPGVQV